MTDNPFVKEWLTSIGVTKSDEKKLNLIPNPVVKRDAPIMFNNQFELTPFQPKPPAVAPSSAVLMGAFGNRLFEQSEFPIAAY